MIALRTNGTWLNLSADTSLNLTMNNPLFDRESIERVFSYPFKLPASPTNLRALSHIHRLDVRANTYKLDAELWIDGCLFETGVLIVNSSNSKTINVTFQNRTTSVFDNLDDVSIKEVGLATGSLEGQYGSFILLTIFTDTIGSRTKCAIEIDGTVFEEPFVSFSDIVDSINATFPGLAEFTTQPAGEYSIIINILDPDNPPDIDLIPDLYDPTVYAFFSQNFDLSNDRIEGIQNGWTNYLGSLYSSTSEIVCFPVIKEPAFYADTNEDTSSFLGYANYTKDGAYIIYDIDNQVTNTLIPHAFVKHVFDQIASSQSLSFAGTLVEDTELRKLIIHNNRSLDHRFEWYDVPNYGVDPADNYGILWEDSFDLANHVPDMSVKNFIISMMAQFCQFVELRNDTFHFVSRKERLTTVVDDWTTIAEPEYVQNFPQKLGFTLDYDRQNDETLNDIFPKYTDGQGREKQEVPWFVLNETKQQPETGETRRWLTPVSKEKGTSPAFNIDEDFTSRLMFFRGLQDDNEGNNYPLGTTRAVDYDGNSVGNYSLEIDGEKGIYETWWKEYLQLLNDGKEVTKIVRLDIQSLLEEKKFEIPRKRIFHTQGEITAVVKSIQVKVTRAGISLAKVKLITQ